MGAKPVKAKAPGSTAKYFRQLKSAAGLDFLGQNFDNNVDTKQATEVDKSGFRRKPKQFRQQVSSYMRSTRSNKTTVSEPSASKKLTLKTVALGACTAGYLRHLRGCAGTATGGTSSSDSTQEPALDFFGQNFQ